MLNMVLYRKYRPKNFSEVVGQDQVTTVLEGAIKNKQVAHAYLFSGSRGTGKTSVARIFAREVGCLWKDIFEMDAASNRGIDEVRELREAVHTLPFESPYKVYIIDEAHMLTKEAFNALLKTLEEPPKHVIFILATTEAHKLPETIISRCQHFQFRRPTEEQIKSHLTQIAKKEGCIIDSESLTLLAMLGDGSFRDAIGNLQKLISFSGDKKITFDEVEKILGAPKVALVHDLLDGLFGGSASQSLEILAKVEESNLDVKLFTKMIMRSVRFAMLLLYAPELRDRIKTETSAEEFKYLERVAKNPEAKLLSSILRELLACYDDIDRAYIKVLPLELAMVKIAHNKLGK